MTPFDPPPPVFAEVTDGRRLAVRRLFCIGRNYADHAREMGAEIDRVAPFFFTKWAEAVVPSGSTIAYPPETADYQHEGELVVAIGTGGHAIAAERALDHVFGYAAGLDMTRRDLQAAAKAKGRPWDAAKNFAQSAPTGAIAPAATVGHPARGAIAVTVNGATRQRSDLAEQLWSVPELIAYVSRFYRLEPGDLLFTGTPAGVGPVEPGDVVTVTIDGLPGCTVTIGPRDA